MKRLHALLAAALIAVAAHASAQDGQTAQGTVEPMGCPVRGYAMVRISIDGAPYMRCAKLAFGMPEPKGGETVVVKQDFSGEFHIVDIAKTR